MHGIVYVPESEAPSDPLEAEGVYYISASMFMYYRRRNHSTAMAEAVIVNGWGNDFALINGLLTAMCNACSQTTRRALKSSQG